MFMPGENVVMAKVRKSQRGMKTNMVWDTSEKIMSRL